VGYPLVWAKLVGGLGGLAVASPTAAALAQARRRLGPAPMRALFELLRGPAAGGLSRRGIWWRGRLVVALDGTQLGVPDSEANLRVYRKGGTSSGATGYPLLRLVVLVACGTRTVIDAVFGPTASGEIVYAGTLVRSLRAGMILLADRNFGYQPLVTAVAATGADLLVRVKNGRRLPACRRLGDGSWISRMGPVEVRVVRCEITIATSAGQRTGPCPDSPVRACDTCPRRRRGFHGLWAASRRLDRGPRLPQGRPVSGRGELHAAGPTAGSRIGRRNPACVEQRRRAGQAEAQRTGDTEPASPAAPCPAARHSRFV
jgi:hypothetical protein